MAAWGHEFYLFVLKVSLNLSLERDIVRSNEIRIPKRSCYVLYTVLNPPPHSYIVETMRGDRNAISFLGHLILELGGKVIFML